MTLLELEQAHKIKAVFIISEDGSTDRMELNDATREKFGDVVFHRIGQKLWESPWQAHQYPQETVSFGVVVALA